MPKLFAVLAIIALLSGIGSGIYYVGYLNGVASEVKKDKKVLIAEVEDHNEDVISLKEHTAIIAEKQKQYKKSLENISLVDNSIPCPVVDLERVYNETIKAANSMHFQN